MAGRVSMCSTAGLMNFNQLRFVTAAAEAGTFTAAAERCYVTQSTLSTGIAQLERELGERLFVRTTRSVALTPFGRQLLPFLADVLGAQAALMDAAGSYLDPESKHVRIGICPLVDLARVDAVLAPFREANRGVDVVLEQMAGVNPRAALEQGRLDFILGPSEIRHHTVERALLYEDRLVYLPAGGSAPGGRSGPVSLFDIADDTFLLVHDRCGLSVRTRHYFRSRRLNLRAYQSEAVSYQMLEEWAGVGVASAILPSSKVSANSVGHPILLGNGHPATIRFEAAWSSTNGAGHVQALAHHLKRGARAP